MNKEHLRQFIEINFGLLLCAIGIGCFFWPTNFVTGGSSGLAILLELIFNKISNTTFLYGINIILLIVSLFTLGKKYFLKTLYSSIMLPTMVLIVELIVKKGGLYDNFEALDSWLVVAFGGILLGTGVGLNLRSGGGTGGVDVIQSICFKYFHFPYSISNYLINLIIIFAGMFYNGLSSGLSAIIFLILSGYIIDTITFGGFNRRAIMIYSEKIKDIRDLIIHDLNRGCTYIKTKGGYTEEETNSIMCVCLTREYLELRQYIQIIDPKAFIVVMRATEVHGLGFSERKKKND